MTDPVPRSCGTHVRSILVPVDGSPGTDRAVPAAVALGARFDVPVRPVVLTPDGPTTVVDGLSARFPQLGDPAATGGPDVVARLLADAEDRSGLIVAAAASTGRGTRAGRRVVCRLLGRATRPLVLLGPEVRSVSPPDRIHVPIDGTERADENVSAALAWASAHGLGVNLIAVVKPQPSSIRRSSSIAAQRFDRDPHSHLARLLERCGHDALDVTSQIVDAPIGLAREVGPLLRNAPPSLLVISSVAGKRHRPFAERWSPMAIVRESPVPVLVVPPSD